MLSFLVNYSIVSLEQHKKREMSKTSACPKYYTCRIVIGLRKYDHILVTLKSLNWLSVKDKLLFDDLVMVHKCMKNLTPNYLSRIFHLHSEIHERNTRQKNPKSIQTADSVLAKGLLHTKELNYFIIIYQGNKR